MVKREKLLLPLMAVLCVSGLYAQRNSGWARRLSSGHVENFFQVDEGLYRSAQPSAKAFVELERMGVEEVLNLRSIWGDNRTARKTSLILHRVKMDASNPNWDAIVAALVIIKNRKGPMLIHCWHGADRTGIVCALYRMVFQNWTRDAAIDELVNGGYGYHAVYKDILTFLETVDVDELRAALR